ncbi:MAG: hypothetical protein KF893_02225 [Caldilineaceae bacterium]|nr:hypothetical protein [Caldilineaceae bacterium]
MSYRLIIRRVVLERIEVLTITIRPAHADGEETEDSPQRRKGRKEERLDADSQDAQDSEDWENLSVNPANP